MPQALLPDSPLLIEAKPPDKMTPEERYQTGCKRVVRQVRLFWRLHKRPMPLRTCSRSFRSGTNNLGDYLDEEPLKHYLMPLIRRTGGILLMPLEAWNAMSVEDQVWLSNELYKREPKREAAADYSRPSKFQIPVSNAPLTAFEDEILKLKREYEELTRDREREVKSQEDDFTGHRKPK